MVVLPQKRFAWLQRISAIGIALLSTGAALLLTGSYAQHRIPLLLDTLMDFDPRALTSLIEIAGLLVVMLGILWCMTVLIVMTSCVTARSRRGAWQTGERFLQRFTPRVIQRVVTGLLGVGISVGVVAPATAAPTEMAFSISSSPHVVAVDVNLGSEITPEADQTPDALLDLPLSWTTRDALAIPAEPVPAMPSSIALKAPSAGSYEVSITQPNMAVVTAVGVVVQPGDSLWSITQRHLGAEASSAEIDVEWRRWFTQNSAIIGANPHLIMPGQTLIPPDPAPHQ